MLVLHGTYENGRVEILEKDLPRIKANVEIKIIPEIKKRKFNSISKLKINTKKYKFSRDEANER
jgi:hypothetical protein